MFLSQGSNCRRVFTGGRNDDLPTSSLLLGNFFIQRVGEQYLLLLSHQQHASFLCIIIEPPTQIGAILWLRHQKGVQPLFSYPRTELIDRCLTHTFSSSTFSRAPTRLML